METWLAERRIARAAADLAPAPGANQPGGWQGLTYIRLHGSPRMYYSAYGGEFLDQVATSIARTKGSAWCIFDNTAALAALGDALSLKGRVT